MVYMPPDDAECLASRVQQPRAVWGVGAGRLERRDPGASILKRGYRRPSFGSFACYPVVQEMLVVG